jgi:hypothetical protein
VSDIAFVLRTMLEMIRGDDAEEKDDEG